MIKKASWKIWSLRSPYEQDLDKQRARIILATCYVLLTVVYLSLLSQLNIGRIWLMKLLGDGLSGYQVYLEQFTFDHLFLEVLVFSRAGFVTMVPAHCGNWNLLGAFLQLLASILLQNSPSSPYIQMNFPISKKQNKKMFC